MKWQLGPRRDDGEGSVQDVFTSTNVRVAQLAHTRDGRVLGILWEHPYKRVDAPDTDKALTLLKGLYADLDKLDIRTANIRWD